MTKKIVAVWRNRIPGLPGDELLWQIAQGLLFPACKTSGRRIKNRKKWYEQKELFNGMVAYAAVQGCESRVRVLFDRESGEFILPDLFKQLNGARRKQRVAEHEGRKKVADQKYKGGPLLPFARFAADGPDRADVPPDSLIIPVPVRMGGM